MNGNAPEFLPSEAARGTDQDRNEEQDGGAGGSSRRRDGKGEPRKNQRGGRGRKKADKDPSRWWRSSEEDDPISLEPIAELLYEPINIKSDDKVLLSVLLTRVNA